MTIWIVNENLMKDRKKKMTCDLEIMVVLKKVIKERMIKQGKYQKSIETRLRCNLLMPQPLMSPHLSFTFNPTKIVGKPALLRTRTRGVAV